jgi:transcriptional regulator with XRE-family HTH domain
MNLRNYLEENDISPKDFAKKLGITTAMLYRYMGKDSNGKIVIPRFDMMMKIIKETNHEVSISSFYFEERMRIREQNKQKQKQRRKDAESTRN